MLASVGDVRHEITTIDGIDNLARHMTGDEDGHLSSSLTCLTAAQPANLAASGPSIDYVAGERLRSSVAQPASLVFPAQVMDYDWRYDRLEFYGEGGTSPRLVDSNPAVAITQLFGEPMGDTMEEPPEKTLRDRLMARRPSMLDAVATSYEDLSRSVGASDRARLEQHAAFLRTLEIRVGGGGDAILAQGCARPEESNVPDYDPSGNARGELDELVTPWIIENLVMSLACDVTRVAGLHFWMGNDPFFPSEFDGESPLAGGNNWHDMVHNTPTLSEATAPDLTQAFQFHGKMFTRLIQRLSEVSDTDGSRLLDNTLVLWVSDLGYGAPHHDFNHPVVMAGLGSAFPGGHGRHVVLPERRSLGDLYAKALRLLGEDDETFGTTGTIGDSGFGRDQLVEWAGYEDYIEPSLPLHFGDFDL
jgi:hypothetical protein